MDGPGPCPHLCFVLAKASAYLIGGIWRGGGTEIRSGHLSGCGWWLRDVDKLVADSFLCSWEDFLCSGEDFLCSGEDFLCQVSLPLPLDGGYPLPDRLGNVFIISLTNKAKDHLTTKGE